VQRLLKKAGKLTLAAGAMLVLLNTAGEGVGRISGSRPSSVIVYKLLII